MNAEEFAGFQRKCREAGLTGRKLAVVVLKGLTQFLEEEKIDVLGVHFMDGQKTMAVSMAKKGGKMEKLELDLT